VLLGIHFDLICGGRIDAHGDIVTRLGRAAVAAKVFVGR
jgi:hypothetical protein